MHGCTCNVPDANCSTWGLKDHMAHFSLILNLITWLLPLSLIVFAICDYLTLSQQFLLICCRLLPNLIKFLYNLWFICSKVSFQCIVTSFGSIRDLIQHLFYLHIILVLLNSSRILKKKIHNFWCQERGLEVEFFVYQKATAAGTSEEFLEQRQS